MARFSIYSGLILVGYSSLERQRATEVFSSINIRAFWEIPRFQHDRPKAACREQLQSAAVQKLP
jgi:hypothetical protein